MKKIVFMGDSLTFGYGTYPENAWPFVVSRIINNKAVTESQKVSGEPVCIQCINKGKNGDFTAGMSARFHRDVLALKPDTVVLLGGSNDILNCVPMNQTLQFIEEMTATAAMAGIHVIVCIPMGIDFLSLKEEGCPPSMIQRLTESFKNYHDALVDFCLAKKCNYIDFWKDYPKRIAELGQAQWSIDGIHPTARGYHVMAEIFCDNYDTLL